MPHHLLILGSRGSIDIFAFMDAILCFFVGFPLPSSFWGINGAEGYGESMGLVKAIFLRPHFLLVLIKNAPGLASHVLFSLLPSPFWGKL